jgi:hypothetical protein
MDANGESFEMQCAYHPFALFAMWQYVQWNAAGLCGGKTAEE